MDEREAAVTEKFYKGGSTIELTCRVERVVGQRPEYIIWHHEDRMLNYDTERGGIRYTCSYMYILTELIRCWVGAFLGVCYQM